MCARSCRHAGEHMSETLSLTPVKTNVLYYGDNLDILPTHAMLTEAAAAGFYENDFWKKKYPRIQIVTVLDLLNGKRPDLPWGAAPFAKAPKEKERAETERML